MSDPESFGLFAPGRDLVLIVAPYSTATRLEIDARVRAGRDLVARGRCPVFAPDMLGRYLDDSIPGERALALALSASVARTVAGAGGTCVVVGSRITEGMASDLAAWRSVEGAPEPDRVGT